ncbi:flagellar motor switch phosphatase FliY [Virgibacillus necropolis]|uniref:Flagellar motor switch phosphatase FliY n=1 Tax=Virgibacillus necropolis TaxID=163877 RepID=A0A221MDF2_9BACI|nr:flagellar motor switch phosphatase FliY [Virgibacillus necropolis]ASN05718.1 flagellar motor switch phosphatase FliY [Virgibacillus necropolis]
MTNDGMLSQDEIDALLKVGSDDEIETAIEDIDNSNFLTTIEEDTLGEIGNISFGSSATTLSTLLSQKVEITTPQVSVIKQEDLTREFTFNHVRVEVKYIEGFIGQNVFVINSEDASIISDIMLGGDGTNPSEELNDIHISAVQEVMNQMMGAAATSMSTIFEKKVDISPPIIKLRNGQNNVKDELNGNENVFVKVSFQLKVGTLIDSTIMQLIPIPFANQLVDELMKSSQAEINEKQAAVGEIEKQASNERNLHKGQEETSQPKPQYLGENVNRSSTNIHQATFSTFDQVGLSENNQRNLDLLLDIPLKVTVELGRTKRTIKDILDLSSGSIIELDKLAGEPVDVFVNKKLIAKGEVVVIDESFGVRLTDIISQSERLMKLK